MAFASVISLRNTIERLLHSSRISLVPPSPEIIRSAYQVVRSLEGILKRFDSSRKRVPSALDGQIREAVSIFEDVLESHLSGQILSRFDEGESLSSVFSIDLQDLKQDIRSFTKRVKRYINKLRKLLSKQEGEALTSRIGFGGKKSTMVGLSDELNEIKRDLTNDLGFHVVAVVGMPGIGKTTVAEELFEDPLLNGHFECRAWVKVGKKYQLSEIARGVLAQVDPNTDKMLAIGYEEVDPYLSKILRCFIVLDDVWDSKVWEYLIRISFSANRKKTKIFFATRIRAVAEESLPFDALINIKMPFLNKIGSWNLLRKKLFGNRLCPPQLEKAGKKIVENCEGLPLMIVTVAELLSKAEKTSEYWEKIAEKQNSVFMDAYNKILESPFSSYEHLPQYLKPCFLYMGVFPQNYEIPRSELFNMWISEGILESNITQTSEDYAKKRLAELSFNSLVILCENSTNWVFELANSIKTCRLHSSLWNFCNKEARKNKFSHILHSRADGLKEGTKRQHRLCIHNNILFGIKDIYNSMVVALGL